MSTFLLAFLLHAFNPGAFASVNCTLDHPDQDVRRIFGEAATYRVRELIPMRHGSKDLIPKLEREMGGTLETEYESREQPYTFYLIYDRAKKFVGLMLGLNAAAVAGPMQVFVAYRTDGHIRDVYVQQISSRDAPAFRSKYYREQFEKFGTGNVLDEPFAKPPVRSPSNDTIKDHHAFIRSVRLNILLVKYLYNAFKE
jgi:hypothetical protein